MSKGYLSVDSLGGPAWAEEAAYLTQAAESERGIKIDVGDVSRAKYVQARINRYLRSFRYHYSEAGLNQFDHLRVFRDAGVVKIFANPTVTVEEL